MGRKGDKRSGKIDRLKLGRLRRITAGVTDHEHPAWSPSGRHLAFYAGAYGAIDIVLCDRRGRFAAVIASGPGNKTQAAFSPDGAKVAYRWQKENGARWEIWEVEILAGPTSATRVLGDSKFDYKHPVYSPCGGFLAYFSDEGSPKNFHLWLLERATGQKRQLTFDSNRNDCHPSWSPDGTELAFHAYEGVVEATESNLYTVSVATGETTRLSPGGAMDKHPFFIDQRYIVFHRYEANGDRGIVVIDRESGASRWLSDPDEDCKHPAPHVSKRGKVRIAFATQERGGELEAEDAKQHDIVFGVLDGLRVARKKRKRSSERGGDEESEASGEQENAGEKESETAASAVEKGAPSAVASTPATSAPPPAATPAPTK